MGIITVVIAVTGSMGRTSIKESSASVMPRFKVGMMSFFLLTQGVSRMLSLSDTNRAESNIVDSQSER